MQKAVKYGVIFVQLHISRKTSAFCTYLVAIIETLFIAKSNKTETKYAQEK